MGKTLLDLVLTDREEVVENVKVEGNMSDSNHKMIEFKLLRGNRVEEFRQWTSEK